MSCIIGIRSKDGVWIGGDSGISKGDRIVTGQEKVFRLNNILIGIVGYWRTVNIVRHEFYPPGQAEETEDEEYFVRLFIPTLVEILQSRGIMEDGIYNDYYKSAAPEFVLGYKNNLYEIDSQMSLMKHKEICALGIGDEFAQGFYNNSPPTMKPRQIINSALDLISKNYNSVRPPFKVEKL